MSSMQKVMISSSEEMQNFFHKAQKEKMPTFLYQKPGKKGVVLDLTKWNRLVELDMDNLIATVEPGLLLGDLQKQLNSKGLRFIPADTPCYSNISVGEWVYRGCPNISSWKYGSGKHFLMGGDYVFPNGDLSPAGGKTVKNVTGYDLIRFFAGGYSNIAIGTRFVLKLLPLPASRKRFCVSFKSVDDMCAAISSLQQRSVWPAWLMWFDESAQQLFFNQAPVANKVMFEIDGGSTEVETHGVKIADLLYKLGGKSIETNDQLPDFSTIEQDDNKLVLLDEFKVPITSVSEFIIRTTTSFKQNGIQGGLFGPVADGKVNIYCQKHSTAEKKMITEIQTLAQALGGAATGKYTRLFAERTPGKLIELENALKKTLDPMNIFNVRG